MARRRSQEKEYLFVDGYNIINSWDYFRNYNYHSLEEARNELISILQEYQAISELDITLVFDAHLVKGNAGTVETYSKLKVVYTQELETADHYIERELDKIGRLKRVKVATSDGLEQQIILGRGGTRISAREFEKEVFGEKTFLNKRRTQDNIENQIKFGSLDEEALKALKKVIKNRTK